MNEIDDGEAGQGLLLKQGRLTDAVKHLHGHQSPFDAFCCALPGALIDNRQQDLRTNEIKLTPDGRDRPMIKSPEEVGRHLWHVLPDLAPPRLIDFTLM